MIGDEYNYKGVCFLDLRRLLISMRLALTPGGERRAAYIRRKKIFHNMGENCLIMKRKIPLYPELISIGNNVRIASNVSFITHDIAHEVLNPMNLYADVVVPDKIGCISIGNNVFIGAGTRILYDIKIGSQVIIATGSVITHDIPDNTVVAGIPARKISTFEEFEKKRKAEIEQNGRFDVNLIKNRKIENIWEEFYERHSKTN